MMRHSRGNLELDLREVYRNRRDQLRRALIKGIALFPGNLEVPRTFAGNDYPFRQDSNLLYFFGVDLPGVVGTIDAETGRDCLYFDPPGLEHRIWEDTSRWDRIAETGTQLGSIADLVDALKQARQAHRVMHFVRPPRDDVLLRLATYLEMSIHQVIAAASNALRRLVVRMREVKENIEIDEIETALALTAKLHAIALTMARPGVHEREIVARLSGVASAEGACLAYPPICTTRGDILHNTRHDNRLMTGDLLLVDIGVESPLGYASDITRTTPVDGHFNAVQARLYDAVYDAQCAALAVMRPGRPFRDAHHRAAMVLSEALADLGIIRGDVEAFVEAAGYAVFFPHGLGHAMGLDVHDMESLGEDHVGYNSKYRRDHRFGPNHLRLGKELLEGMVVTVEPGIYFISSLIKLWQSSGKYYSMINYEKLNLLIGLGGIRIEDNVLITEQGCRILGPAMPRSRREVESNYREFALAAA